MSKRTRATDVLEEAGVSFSVHTYEYDPDAAQIGMQAAEGLGEAPERVLKTLMALVDGKPVCVIVPSDREVSMKKLAAAVGGKSAQMMKPADAERATGYKVGGISPFGQRRTSPAVIEAQAMGHERVFMNGGQRGLQVCLAPGDAQRVLAAIAAPVVAEAPRPLGQSLDQPLGMYVSPGLECLESEQLERIVPLPDIAPPVP